MEPTESPTLPSRPPVAWIHFDQRLIQAMLDFANMEGTPAPSVEPLFWPFQKNLWVRVRPEKKKQLLGTVRYRRGSWNQALSARVMGPYADGYIPFFDRMNIFEVIEMISINLLLPVGALLLSLFVGWRLPFTIIEDELQEQSVVLLKFWRFSMRFVIPPAILMITIFGLDL